MPRILLLVLGWLCQLTAIGFEIYWCAHWWGSNGLAAGILGGPIIALVFPFLYWFKEGFSLFYFGLWFVGVFSFAFARVLKEVS
jgi:hypothetical protein